LIYLTTAHTRLHQYDHWREGIDEAHSGGQPIWLNFQHLVCN
jgi:hypothetical protein